MYRTRRGVCGSCVLGAVVIAAFAVGDPSAAFADSVSLGAARDNTLYESADGVNSNGSGPNFFAGRVFMPEDSIRRGLIAFDLSEIPAGSTITAVTLTLNMNMTINGDQPVGLHRALADWGEAGSVAQGGGGGGANAQPGDATWTNTFWPNQFWTVNGGDFDPSASDTQMVNATGAYTWGSTEQMVADVQSWLDAPESNFGWLVLGNESTFPTSKRFASRENSDPLKRPALTIEFRPGTSPCTGDTNDDNVVNVTDLINVINGWGTDDPVADVNGDGIVDVLDLVLVITSWGPCPS